MKKILLIAVLATIALQKTAACDVCGCSLGGNYYGILPLYNKSFVGLRWSQAKFHSYIKATQNLPAQSSDDTYSKMELWGRYYITRRIQLFAFVPYVSNKMDGTEQNVQANGPGDISVIANYVIINTGDQNKDFKHQLMAGGGIKLPTGKFDLEDQGKIINRNFQMGTGSIDFAINAIYTLRYKKAGVNLETGYKMNTRNRDDYLFGNQYRTSAQLFFWQKIGPVSLLPHAGMNFEQADMHKEGDIIQTNTGGKAWLASGGMDIYVRRITVGLNYQNPVSQQYNSDETAEITSKARWTTSLTFNF